MPSIQRTVLVGVPLARAREVITDVERYPEFVPACDHVEVIDRNDNVTLVKVDVSGMGIRETFVTRNIASADGVRVELERGPFNRLTGEWRLVGIGEEGCRVSLDVDFEANTMLAAVLRPMASAIADRMVEAYVRRMEGS